MAIQNEFILRCFSTSQTLTIDTINPTTFSQELTFSFSSVTNVYNSQIFGLYNGEDVQNKFRFPIQSNFLLKDIRLSIPNLPGARYAVDPQGVYSSTIPARRRGYTIGLSSQKNPPSLPVLFDDFDISINKLEEWVPINRFIQAEDLQNTSNEAVFIYTSLGTAGSGTSQKIFVDFRNVQTVFDAIDIYLLAELKVVAPFEPQ